MNFDDEEIQKLKEEWSKLSRDEKIDKFLWKMVWFHHTKHTPGSPAQPIWDLTKEIKEANTSSATLTKSIRNATWVAVIVGGLAVVIAGIKLLKDLNIF